MATKLVVIGSEITEKNGRETSDCFACLQTKRNLDRADVPYEYIGSNELAADIGHKLNFLSKPVVVVFDESDSIFIDKTTRQTKDDLSFLKDAWSGLVPPKIDEIIEILHAEEPDEAA